MKSSMVWSAGSSFSDSNSRERASTFYSYRDSTDETGLWGPSVPCLGSKRDDCEGAREGAGRSQGQGRGMGQGQCKSCSRRIWGRGRERESDT